MQYFACFAELIFLRKIWTVFQPAREIEACCLATKTEEFVEDPDDLVIPINDLEAHVPVEPGAPPDLMQLVVEKHKAEVFKARKRVGRFLVKNGFLEINSKKQGRFISVTYPLHEAVKQNNAYITWKLLIFGANPLAQDHWFCTAYDYAKGQASHQQVREVFERLCLTPNSLRFKGLSKLERNPPPLGFERFFAKVAQDPLVPWFFRKVACSVETPLFLESVKLDWNPLIANSCSFCFLYQDRSW